MTKVSAHLVEFNLALDLAILTTGCCMPDASTHSLSPRSPGVASQHAGVSMCSCIMSGPNGAVSFSSQQADNTPGSCVPRTVHSRPSLHTLERREPLASCCLHMTACSWLCITVGDLAGGGLLMQWGACTRRGREHQQTSCSVEARHLSARTAAWCLDKAQQTHTSLLTAGLTLLRPALPLLVLCLSPAREPRAAGIPAACSQARTALKTAELAHRGPCVHTGAGQTWCPCLLRPCSTCADLAHARHLIHYRRSKPYTLQLWIEGSVEGSGGLT